MAIGVVPKRLGLKYKPVPTLALEYEDELEKTLKLAVVELPELQLFSQPQDVVARVQKENQLFAPSIVNEDQLCRLMKQLIEHQKPPNEAMPELPPRRRVEEPVEAKDESDEEDGEPKDVDEPKKAEETKKPTQDPEPALKRVEEPQATIDTRESLAKETKAASDDEMDQKNEANKSDHHEEDNESEFEESFEEESFMEESADAAKPSGSFLTQPPPDSTKRKEDDDDEADTPRGKFGTAVTRSEDEGPKQSSSSTSTSTSKPAVETPPPAVDPPKAKVKVDESAEEIPSDEEELDYFSGGDESGDDDGF